MSDGVCHPGALKSTDSSADPNQLSLDPHFCGLFLLLGSVSTDHGDGVHPPTEP